MRFGSPGVLFATILMVKCRYRKVRVSSGPVSQLSLVSGPRHKHRLSWSRCCYRCRCRFGEALLNDQRVADTIASRKSEDGSIIKLVASDLEHSEHWPKYEKEVTPPAASNIEESATGANVGEAQAHIASNEKDCGMRATNFTQASAKVASWITEKRGETSRFVGTIASWKKIKDNLLSIIGIARKAWKAAPASPGIAFVPTKATFRVINQKLAIKIFGL